MPRSTSQPMQTLPSTRSALRLVKTTHMSRQEWLEVRRRGIGSSDAAAAVGVSPYQSPLELWMIKTGRTQGLPQLDADDDRTPVHWGQVLEPIVARAYERRTGNRVRRVNAVLQHPDPDRHWMLANIDREVVANPQVQILECKTAGLFGARHWQDGVPEYVQVQVQHQLAVTGKGAADVAVLIAGQELRIFRIERDESLIADLIQLERHFWRFVETDTPPPVDGSGSSDRALQALFPADHGEVRDWRQDNAWSDRFWKLLELREQRQSLEAEEQSITQEIKCAMGDASKALFADGAVSWKRSRDRQVLDTDLLYKNHPKLAARYQCLQPGSRRFRISAS